MPLYALKGRMMRGGWGIRALWSRSALCAIEGNCLLTCTSSHANLTPRNRFANA